MDYDKLIEQLNARGLGNGSSLGYHCGLFDEASTALEASWHENQALRGLINGLDAELSHVRADLARVTAERDGAIKDLNEFLSMDELCPIQCEWCKWNGTYCDGKTPEWRGIKED